MGNNNSIGEKLTYAYLRNIKKWMFCPACKNGKMKYYKKKSEWVCEDCYYQLSREEFEDNYIFWFCDECESYLNNQEGFDRNAIKHICTNCGYENDTTFGNVRGICSDCGKKLPDPDDTLCIDCKLIRKQKAKEKMKTVAKAAGAIAAVAGAAYAASRSSGKSEEKATKIEDLALDNQLNEPDSPSSEPNYPTCKSCGTLMIEFDGWAWYTCPKCGNAVRIIDGVVTWQDEVFSDNKNAKILSDFELADLCRGGELTEDD